MDAAPLVSIGLPTRNRAHLLPRAVESLLAQDHPNFEIVLADNASDDDTAAISARFAHTHAHVRHERVETPLPIFENFRRALLLGRGPYFMWASDDDRWEPQCVATLVRLLEEDRALALASGEARYALVDGPLLPFFSEGEAFRPAPPETECERLLQVARHAYGNLMYGVYRRDALVQPDGSTVLDDHASAVEIPFLLAVGARGGIRTCADVLLRKSIPLPVYLSRAREVGVTPDLPADLQQQIALERRKRGGVRWFFKRLRGAAYGTRKTTRQAWRDIRRAIQGLPVDEGTKRAVRRACARRVWGGYFRSTVGWTLRDAFRRQR